MESNFSPSPSEAHLDTRDFMSLAWCNLAVQALQKQEKQDQSLVLIDDPGLTFESHDMTQYTKLDNSALRDSADVKPPPPWKSTDVKSWIWMQQAMHPELNYNSYFRKKWMSWKLVPFKNMSIKKWLKEIKQRQKEERRLQRAEVHAAISMAGVAAALATIAAESSGKNDCTVKEAAVTSAAALVAHQCAKVAEAMGAKKEQISSVIGSAMSSTTASDMLTLTAAAATSLKGVDTLKARAGCRNMLDGSAPVLPIEDNHEVDFDFEKCRKMLAVGVHLSIETPDGIYCRKYTVRSVSVILSSEAKVVLKIRKLSLLKSKQESIILDMHAELYKDSETETGTGYLIVLTTSKGAFKLDMEDNYHWYQTWATTINHMLVLSNSFSKYHLQFYKK